MSKDRAKSLPDMTWLRLSVTQSRVFLLAWSARSISVKGYDLMAANALCRRGLLHFVRPLKGGERGEFKLSPDGRAYPPKGLKALVVRHAGCLEVSRETKGRAALKGEEG